ncbi:MAG: hypothetical protein AAF403_04590 [Pseudomonadota bacterium]
MLSWQTRSAYSDSTRILPGFEDVPVFDPLIADPNTLLFFDHPAGRIVEIYAASELEHQDQNAFEFYHHTLPQLGWTGVSKGRFTRADELLSIDVLTRSPTTLLRFTIAPQPDTLSNQ